MPGAVIPGTVRRKAAVHTLGCKVNQYDSDKLMEELSRYGYETANINEQADLYIINTCTVTQTGAAKSRQMLRGIKSKNPSALTVACGCLVKTNPDDVTKTGVDFIFDACRPRELTEFLKAKKTTDTPLPLKKRTRAYLKIQDGCDRFCSYCIVPYARGELASRSPAEIIAEARELIENGTREIVLTGIQAAAYGKDTGGMGFPEIIKRVSALPGLARLRLGSIEPYAVNDEFAEAISAGNVCPHFHLSLQSGCNKTLEAMNRRYTTDFYKNAAEKIRRGKPGAAFTTDVMVGFPGETDADFRESFDFVSECGFAKAHVFIYSPRKGTPAAAMPGQVPNSVKTERGRKMRELAESLERAYLTGRIGNVSGVLFETKRGRYWEGHTADYMTVRAESENNLANEIADVNLQKEEDCILYGGII